MSIFTAPHPPYDPTDKSGFSYETVVKRWPIIITGVIDTLHQACHQLSLQSNLNAGTDSSAEVSNVDVQESTRKKIKEATGIIEKLSKLKYEMARDKPLVLIPDDGEPHVDTYNSELAALAKDSRDTWFTAPWLFAECYLYRLLRSFFVQTDHWASIDPFQEQKMKTFAQSGKAIYQIATTMHELEVDRAALRADPEKLGVLFNEMIQMCLWGNATDLSLLTHLSQEDIAHLQSVGKEARAARSKFILRGDEDAVWAHIKGLEGKEEAQKRVDFVLDNSGFELFTDLVFADFLVTYTPYVTKVVFHPKLIPWFVSDVTPPDFKTTFDALEDASSFFSSPTFSPSDSETTHMHTMVSRWQSYLASGVFSLSVPVETPLGGGGKDDEEVKAAEFWTSPYPYWDMRTRSPGAFESLRGSGLVIFKGDLNYRKLTGDVAWPAWTSFNEALGPLAGSFPLLSLRTNKADVVVGVEKAVAERLDARGEKWRVDGRYALISFLGLSAGVTN
ncbi:unnamed protein product [Cyclocybe aegerita]|uniref:Sugar phosphate phosphatase n=1 Tax=Cyclocybe aegerita TaxID=1973307 RepID=A0A8S0XQ58_CYCAE|nr:unnamed protein product [Cyclocybe aegerita]